MNRLSNQSGRKRDTRTPTRELLQQARLTKNPVTRSVLWDIIGNRIDRAMEKSGA